MVVNCSGIGARKLVGDKLVSPLRGQVSSLRTIFENLRSPEFSAVHNVYFVKYDVTVSFMAQVLDTVTYLVPQGIRYSVIIKLPCALLQTGHLETVHTPVADTVAYFADLDAPVVDTVTYFGGNHRSRV